MDMGHSKPKIASMMWSADLRAEGKLSTNGTSRSSSCLASRYENDERPSEGQDETNKKRVADGQHNVHETLTTAPRQSSTAIEAARCRRAFINSMRVK